MSFSASNALLFCNLALQPWCLTLSYLAFHFGLMLPLLRIWDISVCAERCPSVKTPGSQVSLHCQFLPAINILCIFSLDLFQSFMWLCDITMKNCFPFFVVLSSLYFSVAQTYLLSRPQSGEPPPTNPLESRQAPGVIATSDFLRRGYQACKYQMQSSGAMVTVIT